jgi:hypothetical protein
LNPTRVLAKETFAIFGILDIWNFGYLEFWIFGYLDISALVPFFDTSLT